MGHREIVGTVYSPSLYRRFYTVSSLVPRLPSLYSRGGEPGDVATLSLVNIVACR